MYIIIAVLLFGLLIFIHELGHFLTARLFGVAINEFSIGMGPQVFSHTSKKTNIVYSLRALPIGGYVSMAGEDEESDNPNAFDKKPVWQRMIITVAGATFNVLLGFIVMFIIVVSTNDLASTQVSKLHERALSGGYGVQAGDIITKINDENVHILTEFNYILGRSEGEPVDVTVIRDGKELVLEDVVFALRAEDGESLSYGRDFYVHPVDKTPGNVIKISFYQSTLYIRLVIDAVGDLITGKYGVEDLSGPVGVTEAISNAAKESGLQLWSMFVLLAMNLGVMNLLPFPALDGGRLITLVIELIIRRPVNKKIEGYINFVGMMILFAFMAFITIKDIGAIIQRFTEK